mmetsp:Transcript_17854/g.42269  ORF Transcript_17854/g.42269 Transcript_17854/m.42269 type:complete len:207 (-) Transcript_17854:32-652(-)
MAACNASAWIGVMCEGVGCIAAAAARSGRTAPSAPCGCGSAKERNFWQRRLNSTGASATCTGSACSSSCRQRCTNVAASGDELACASALARTLSTKTRPSVCTGAASAWHASSSCIAWRKRTWEDMGTCQRTYIRKTWEDGRGHGHRMAEENLLLRAQGDEQSAQLLGRRGLRDRGDDRLHRVWRARAESERLLLSETASRCQTAF